MISPENSHPARRGGRVAELAAATDQAGGGWVDPLPGRRKIVINGVFY